MSVTAVLRSTNDAALGVHVVAERIAILWLKMTLLCKALMRLLFIESGFGTVSHTKPR